MRHTVISFAAVVSLLIVAPAAASPTKAPPAATLRLGDLSSPDTILRWMASYRAHPDPANVPNAVRAMSRMAAFKDPETSGSYVGFIAGVLSANPKRADDLINQMLTIRPEDHWVIVRAVAYSGLPNWKALLRKFAHRMPTRRVMIDKYVGNRLPTLYQVKIEKSPTMVERVQGYMTFGKQTPKEVALDQSPELLDTFWGFYYATGTYRPISRIVEMLPLSKDEDSVEKLTLGSMAKFTLVSNAARDAELLAMLKRAKEFHPKEVVTILTEVIDAAEGVETARVRKEATAAIEELRRKGPGYRRSLSAWGQIGQGALALGCIAAAATGHIELGLPCVLGGSAASAGMYYWEKNP
jgi:hypothetical protein